MRRAIIFTTLALASSVHATTSDIYTETLVGWSDDGERYAIVRSFSPSGPARLEVRQKADKPDGRDKFLAGFDEGSKGVPAATDTKPGVERIDVATWEPVKKYSLKQVESKARDRFKADFELTSLGSRIDKFHCKNGGWSLKRKGAKPIVEVKAVKTACFQPLGGYVHANGKYALVKLTETSATDSSDPNVSYSDSTSTVFVLVELPPK